MRSNIRRIVENGVRFVVRPSSLAKDAATDRCSTAGTPLLTLGSFYSMLRPWQSQTVFFKEVMIGRSTSTAEAAGFHSISLVRPKNPDEVIESFILNVDRLKPWYLKAARCHSRYLLESTCCTLIQAIPDSIILSTIVHSRILRRSGIRL